MQGHEEGNNWRILNEYIIESYKVYKVNNEPWPTKLDKL